MAGKKSITAKLGRVRPPRVHITYEVYTGGAMEKRELPFVVGVLADLSGTPDKPLPRLADRKFIEIDRDNFDQVLAKQEPTLSYRVANKLTSDDRQLAVKLKFKKLADFEPQNVVRQIEPMSKLLELRTKLANIRGNLYGNQKFGEVLQEAIAKTEELAKRSQSASTEDSEKKG